jgi:hypothetical protein
VVVVVSLTWGLLLTISMVVVVVVLVVALALELHRHGLVKECPSGTFRSAIGGGSRTQQTALAGLGVSFLGQRTTLTVQKP